MGINNCCRVNNGNTGMTLNIQDTNETIVNDKKCLLNKHNTLAPGPPEFSTHPSLDRGKVVITGDKPKIRGVKIGRTPHQVQQKDIYDTKKRHKRINLTRGEKGIFDLNQAVEIPENLNEEVKACRVSSVALFASPSAKLKVAPYHFRVEKPGKLEDTYQNLGVIGKGGYGEVRKMKNFITHEIRAVKAIEKSKCQMTSNFSDEIRILQKLVFFRKENIKGSSKLG